MARHERDLRVRLVDVERIPAGLRIDGLATKASDDEATGEPVTLLVALPDTAWMALAIEELMQEWADAADLIEFGVVAGARGPTAVIDHLGTVIRGTLLAVA